MVAIRAIVLGAAFLAGCTQADDPHTLDDWIWIGSVEGPIRFEQLAQSVEDSSCLTPEGIKVMGDIDQTAVSEIIDEVRSRHSRSAVLMVRAKGRYAELWTGGGCRTLGGPHGNIHHLRRDDGRWKLKETTEWVS